MQYHFHSVLACNCGRLSPYTQTYTHARAHTRTRTHTPHGHRPPTLLALACCHVVVMGITFMCVVFFLLIILTVTGYCCIDQSTTKRKNFRIIDSQSHCAACIYQLILFSNYVTDADPRIRAFALLTRYFNGMVLPYRWNYWSKET
jgi:hypothetical protein